MERVVLSAIRQDEKDEIENCKLEEILKEKQKNTLNVKKNKKLTMYKCKICKTSGRKCEVKMCSKCKYFFHK